MKTSDGYVEHPEYVFYEDGSTFLSHYGVLGMKWGVRNAETQAKYANKKRAKQARKAEARGLKNKRKKAEASRHSMRSVNREKIKSINSERKEANRNRALLSDSELDKRIRRLQKEKQLNDLTQAELMPARYAVKQALVKVGTDTIKSESKGAIKDTLHPSRKK